MNATLWGKPAKPRRGALLHNRVPRGRDALVASLACLLSLCAGASTGINVFGDPDEIGTPSPDYGEHTDVTEGTTYKLTCPAVATNAAQTIAYRLKGWELRVNEVLAATNTAENVTNCAYVCTNATDTMSLTWKWEASHYKLETAVAGSGSVTVPTSWLDASATLTVTATPAAGWKFWKWTGSGFSSGETYRTNCTVTVSEPMTVTANFYDPAATPRVVRYVKTSAVGKKDGTSWADAYGDLTTAYNAVAANPSGGEVWLAKGRHSLNSAIAIVPRINVRGGFAGTETDASEANATNITILSDSSFKNGSEKWLDSAKTPMWTGSDKMTFVDPPDYGDDNMPFSHGYYGGGTAFERTDGGLIEDNEISNLDFFYYKTHAVSITAENASPLVFRNCRFLTCGWHQHNTDKTFNITGTPIEMYGCRFSGCQNPVFLTTASTSSPVTTNVFDGCDFYTCEYNWACSKIAGGIAVYNNAKLIVRNSTFEKCLNIREDYDDRGGAILIRSTQDALIEDTLIRRSVAKNRARSAGLGISPVGATPTITLNRCRFEKNRYSGIAWDSHSGVGAAIGGYGSCILNMTDCTFTGNIVTNSTFSDPAASCIGHKGTWYGNLANCTFEDNVAIDTAGRAQRYTISSSWTSGRYFTFANCVFNNNTCCYTNTGSATSVMVYRPEFRRPNVDNEGQTYTFVNCVFHHDAADYIPFANDESLSWGNDFNFASCVSSSFCGWGSAIKDKTFRYQPLDNETLAPLADRTVTNGVAFARGIAKTSAYCRKGVPVYRDKYGELFIYDEVFNKSKPWRHLRSPTTVYTPAEGEARGLSLSAPIADFKGRGRHKLRTTLGPLDNYFGFAIIVR